MDYEDRILKIYNEYENLEVHEDEKISAPARYFQVDFMNDLEDLLEQNERIIDLIKRKV